MTSWEKLSSDITACERCPRLRDYCRQIAVEKRKAYRDWDYWGRPVPNFGDPQARLLLVGLAPAAHGANRTGRMFTGDRSGDWLYAALHRAGFASQAEANRVGDGLVLYDCAITATCHCAPPDNRPSRDEIAACRGWLQQTIDQLPARVFLALGQIAWNELVTEFRRREWLSGPKPAFGHGAAVRLLEDRLFLGSYHPSQQNTFTGRLTREMLDAVLERAKEFLSGAATDGTN